MLPFSCILYIIFFFIFYSNMSYQKCCTLCLIELYAETVALKQINPNLKVLLAVGGWTHGTATFTEMVRFSYSLLSICNNKNLTMTKSNNDKRALQECCSDSSCLLDNIEQKIYYCSITAATVQRDEHYSLFSLNTGWSNT